MENIALIVYALLMIVGVILRRSSTSRSQRAPKESHPVTHHAPLESQEKDPSKQSPGAPGPIFGGGSFQEQKEAMSTVYENLLQQWQEAEGKMKKGLVDGGRSSGNEQIAKKLKKKGPEKSNAKRETKSSKGKSATLFQENQKGIEEASPEGKSFMEAYLEERKQVDQGAARGASSAAIRQERNFLETLQEASADRDREIKLWRQAILMREILDRPRSLRNRAQ